MNTTQRIDLTTQIARALAAREAAKREMYEHQRQQRTFNLLLGWAAVVYVFLFGIGTPIVLWWLLTD